MVDMLEALQREVDRGTIRAFGLSNETAWGMDQWLRLSQAGHGPRAATIQNEYSLLYRTHDLDLAELSVNEDVGLLAYSPLGTGLLTGKYMGGAVPKGSRLAVSGHLSGRHTDRAVIGGAGLCWLGGKVWFVADPSGLGLLPNPPVYGIGHLWGHHCRAAWPYYRRQRCGIVSGPSERFGPHPPRPPHAVLDQRRASHPMKGPPCHLP